MRRIALFAACIVLSGCGVLRGGVIKISEENVKNIETAEKLTDHLIIIWPFLSGVYSANSDLLPMNLLILVRKVDEILLEEGVTTKEKLTKKQKAEAGTYYIRLIAKSAKVIYGQFAPAIINAFRILGI